MAEVIQAKCPHCKETLRVPADWLGRSLRCKHCKQVFKAKGKEQAAPPAAAAAPVAAQAQPKAWISPAKPVPAAKPAALPAAVVAKPAPKPAGDPFAFDDDSSPNGDVPPPAPRPAKPGRRLPTGGIIGGLAVVIALALGFFFRDNIAMLFNPQASEPIAAGKENEPGKVTPETSPNVVENTNTKSGDTQPSTKKNSGADSGAPIVKRPTASGPFPRRALLIGINNYLLANTVDYGSSKTAGAFAGASTGALKEALALPPFNMPAGQVFELSDASKSATSTLKPVIEAAITDFVNTSREQDRIVLFFSGHAIDHEMESYLVPWEGDMKNKDTLIPLSWVYDKLAKCKARQKVLVLDVCRLPTSRGFELPGGGAGAPNFEMPEGLDAKLQSPPDGVQVLTACVKGQNSVDLGTGSVFMEAICSVRSKLAKAEISEPTQPLPLANLVKEANAHMKNLLAAQKTEQTARLSGKEPEGDSKFNPGEAAPAAVAFKTGGPGGAKSANMDFVKNILDELNLIPPAKASQLQAGKLDANKLPPFSMADLEPYKAEYKTLPELQSLVKGRPDQYVLRASVLKAGQKMQDTFKFALQETLGNPSGEGGVSAEVKKTFLAKQKEPGMAIFQLEVALNELKAAGDKREEEPSKRWQAHYDYCMARMMSRIVFVYEYDFILAQVRSDSLPSLEKIHNGWRVGSRGKVQISEAKVKDMVKKINQTWEKIATEHPGTPWALMARREQMTALGLEWRPSRD